MTNLLGQELDIRHWNNDTTKCIMSSFGRFLFQHMANLWPKILTFFNLHDQETKNIENISIVYLENA